MRVQAFARLVAVVATAFVAHVAVAYAPMSEVPSGAASPGRTGVAPSGPAGNGLPQQLGPSFDEDEEDLHTPADEAIDVPAPARAGIADVKYGDDGLPDAVADRRHRLIAAAKTGDIEALRPVFEDQSAPPIVSTTGDAGDPVDFLRRQSGDEDGREILAILLELLESGHVAITEGPVTTYVWPYFAEVPLADLLPPHYVELYRVLTAVDVEEMQREGRYLFFRVGISEDGRLRYLTAGDLE